MEAQFRGNFSVVSTTRNGRRGGGVSILVSKSYVASCTQVHLKIGCDDDDISLEVTAASFRPHKLPRGFPDVIVFGVYLAEFERSRQSKGILRLKEAIENALVSGNRNSRPLIFVAGDFNGANVSPLLSSLRVHQLNRHATRGERCLDLILTNAPKCYASETWPELGASDHKTVVALPPLSRYRERLPVAETRPVRSGKICDTVAEIRAVNWSPTIALLNQDPQSATDEFYSIMRTAEDLHQPIKMLRTRGDKPWMTLEIKRLIHKRQRLHQQGFKQRWKQLAGIIKRKIAERKKQYNRKKYSTANHDYWKEVKSLADPSNRQPVSQEFANDLNSAFHQVWNGRQQPDLNRFRSIVADPPAEPVFTYSNVGE